MGDILFRYERVNPTTWAYLSSLLSLALFFKFNRFWSVRNLDLLLILLLAPGLLCIKYGIDRAAFDQAASSVEVFGYVWLFSVNGVLLLRMLIDSAMVRRPLLEPNLTVGGLTFLAVSLLAFLTANVITGAPEKADIYAVQRAEHLSKRESSQVEQHTLDTHGPGFTLFYFLPHISTQRLLGEDDEAPPGVAPDAGVSTGEAVTSRVMAIISQLMIVVGVVWVGVRHFDNPRMGIAAATLYLMLPYTAMWTGAVTHALPGALLVWAVLWYRRPVVSGALIGALCGSIYYPVFLLPLWVAFYWSRGRGRFLAGFCAALAVLVATLIFTSTDTAMFFDRLGQMLNFRSPRMDAVATLNGVWHYWTPVYRIPIIAAFVGLSFSLVFWPAQKNLGTLMSCSAAIMLGTQFWHAHSGGMSLAWYLPLLLLTVFRPNLEDRVAVDVVFPSPWRRPRREAAA